MTGTAIDVVRRPVVGRRVLVLGGERARERPDQLVTEEPMEIRLHGPHEEPVAVAVTMRTPGNDFELAVGFLRTEGLLEPDDRIASVAYCLGGEGEQQYNVVTVRIGRPVATLVRDRRFLASASCGICGKSALEEIEVRCAPVAPGPVVDASVLMALPERLRAAQSVFDATGGLHAAATFTPHGELANLREDVGRHNALDKLVGEAVLAGALPLHDRVLLVSGRLGFELVQKAAVAGIPVVAAVGAPSSLAVRAAERFGITVVGFLRGDRANVYSGRERIAVER